MTQGKRPVVLIVRDGWGRNPHVAHDPFNAIKLAHTPRCDALLADYPHTLIHTSGEDVGLPEGTMGNSEVGHQNLGAGRIVDQESVRISKEIRTGTFFDNPTLVAAVQAARDGGAAVHLMGIASDAGVHGLLTHLYACIELCKRCDMPRVYLHLFTDGRDTGPFTGRDFVTQIQAQCKRIGVGSIASLCGRYYAMDRDNRWQRVQRAYNLLTVPGGAHFDTPQDAFADYYANPTNDSQTGDEFITPRMIGTGPRIRDGDTVIFYNYRGDRPRELTRAFVMPTFLGEVPPSPDTGDKGFDRGAKLDLRYVTMTAYDQKFSDHRWVQVVYPKPPKMPDIAGRYLSEQGLTQFRCAETEKFPHVTFFFSDYREKPFEGESREMAQSPKVPTYDLQPQMSAGQITQLVLARVRHDDFILVNFANCDMVGHTGKLDAAIQAVQTVDDCVGRLVDAVLNQGGALIVTADHGNAEQMFDPATGAPHTAHTTYDVPLIVVDPDRTGMALRPGGRLADVMPTALEMLGLAKPEAMTGVSLLSGPH